MLSARTARQGMKADQWVLVGTWSDLTGCSSIRISHSYLSFYLRKCSLSHSATGSPCSPGLGLGEFCARRKHRIVPVFACGFSFFLFSIGYFYFCLKGSRMDRLLEASSDQWRAKVGSTNKSRRTALYGQRTGGRALAWKDLGYIHLFD